MKYKVVLVHTAEGYAGPPATSSPGARGNSTKPEALENMTTLGPTERAIRVVLLLVMWLAGVVLVHVAMRL